MRTKLGIANIVCISVRPFSQTCSHGVACNFIHCFRNPGGDYEWADWDNPPPRYWIRKMVALFGPSVDTMYEKASYTPDFKSSEPDRKKLKNSSNRYILNYELTILPVNFDYNLRTMFNILILVQQICFKRI